MRLVPRFTLVFVAYAAALLTSVAWLTYNSGRDSLRSATLAELEATTIEKQAALNRWLDDRQSGIARLAAVPAVVENAAALAAIRPGSPGARAARARLVAELEPWVSGGYPVLMLLDPQTGEVLAATDPAEEGKFKEDRPFFLEGRTRPYVQNLHYSLALQGPAMTAAAPLRAPDGRLLGVLAGRLDLEEMNEIIGRRSGRRQTDDAYLVNTSNLFVTQPRFITDPAVLQRGVRTTAVKSCLTGVSGVVETGDYRNIPAIIVYHWLSDWDLCLVVKMDQAEAYGPVRALGRVVAAINAAALLLAVALAVVLARGLTRPILALQAGAIRLGRGELGMRLPATGRDELGSLAREFNQMAVALADKEAQLRAHAGELEQLIAERTAELRQSEELFRRVTEASPNAMLIVGQDGAISFCNPAALALFGYRREALLGLPLERLVPQRFRARHSALRAGFSADPRARPMGKGRDLFALRQDGVEVPVEIGLSPMTTNGGPSTLATITDISERKLADEKLRASERSLGLFVEYAPAAIAMFDREMRYLAASRRYAADYRLPDAAFVGRSHYEVFPEIPERWREIHRRCLAGGIESAEEDPFPRQDGTLDWVRWEIHPWYEKPGEVGGLLLFSEVITERKRAEEVLTRYAEELRRSNADLEQFAYVASHDLQEPLRMVASYARLLAKRYQGQLDAEADEFIAYVVDGATRMQQLINSLLDYSRVGTRGKQFAPVSCETALDEALANLSASIAEAGAVIQRGPLPSVLADKAQLVQLFQNLIGNALRFRNEQPPEIHVSATPGPAHWRFAVRDNGIGLEPQYFERIFIIFQRLHTRAEYPGTGIGLAICKKIVERHGGRIWVESQPGQGATFLFTLPDGPPGAATALGRQERNDEPQA